MASDGSIKILTDLDTSGFEKGINKLSGLAPKGLGTVLKSVAAVSGALGAASGFAVKVGSDFEAGMSEVFGLGGIGLAGIQGAVQAKAGRILAVDTNPEKFTLAKEMGATTKFSATESAEALKYMAMAGWDTDKMLSGLPGVMNLAAASGENLGTVSDIVTDAMTAFGLSADKAGHFADVLAQASSKSNTNVGMMGETFKYVAPVAGALGYSVEDAAVAIGLMANSGIKSSQAGTALRQTLTRLAKPTDEVKAAMEDLGISLTDSEGNMKSLGEVILDMRKGFKNLTKDQQAQYAASIAGQEGMSGLLAIVNASDEDFNTLAEAIQNSDGAAQSMADTMQDNLKGAVTIAKSALEGLGITVYEEISTPMKNAVETATEYTGQLQRAFEAKGIEGAVSTLGTVLASAATKVAQAAPKMVDAGANMIVSFVQGISKNARKLSTAAVNVGKSLVSALLKFVPEAGKAGLKVITAFAKQLVGYKLGKEIESLGGTIIKSFSDISRSMSNAIGKITPIIEKMASAAIKAAEGGIEVLANTIEFLCNHIDVVLPLVSAAATAFAALSIAKNAATWIQGATTAFQGLTAAMSLNPFTLAVAGAAALVAILVTVVAMQEDTVTSAERLAESQENLAESCQGVFDQYGAWSDAVKAADGSLDALTSTMGIAKDKQQELAAEMDAVQAQITAIMKTASDERRGYTEAEIQTLKDLFAQMRSLSEQELAIQQSYQDAVLTQASNLLDAENMTAESYTEYAARIAAQAETTRDAVINSASDKYTQAIAYAEQEREAVLNSEAGKNEEQKALAEQAYQDAINTAAKEYQAAVDAANAKCNDTSEIIAQGYAKNADLAHAWSEEQAMIAAEETANANAYKQELIDVYQNYIDEVNRKGYEEVSDKDNLQKQLLDIEERYTDRIASTNNRRAANLDEATQKQIATLLEMVAESGSAYDDLDSTTQQMVDGFMENIDRLSPETKESLNDTLKGMGMTIDSNGKLLYNSGEKSGQEVIKGWKSKIPSMQSAADEAIKEIDARMKAGLVSSPGIRPIEGTGTVAANALAQIQSYLNNNPVYATVRTSHAAGGYWARGGVTKYARGGMTPEIHKHAAGVFTKRTRLWDPVTGINEYGEAGHEALLPLKTSVYDEIAKGIVRQLSPAKLSGIVDMLRSAVRERNETVTVQVQERRDLRAAEKATLHEEGSGVEELREEVAVLGSRMEQVLTLLKELLGTSKSGTNALLQALLGMRIDLDGEAVGRLIAPEINERLNDLYELEERGRF